MRARRVDDNHRQIVEFFRKAGCAVLDTARLGDGAPDCFVSLGQIGCGPTAAVEIKDGEKPPSARKLKPKQKEFAQTWKGMYFVVESIETAQRVVDALRVTAVRVL